MAGADAIELRLDLFPQGCTPEQVPGLARCPLPLIITVRSRQEGGNFRGTPDDWWTRVLPWLEYAAFVDIEQQFSMLAPPI
ncbi:MAG TPA: type I 3-dehydroquinate dehydratase, partial [Methanoregulaceae archaeon]|nr:type I 3-dehydroquinate dehydratase [Methanoregulaceae archaeon]